MREQDIAFKELNLNIKAQDVKVKEPMIVGYEYDEGIYVFILVIPNKLLKFGRKKWTYLKRKINTILLNRKQFFIVILLITLIFKIVHNFHCKNLSQVLKSTSKMFWIQL